MFKMKNKRKIVEIIIALLSGIFVWLSTVTASEKIISNDCPFPCVCSWAREARRNKERDLYEIDCAFRGLTRVVLLDGLVGVNDLVRINLHNNHISILKKYSFEVFSNRKIISVDEISTRNNSKINAAQPDRKQTQRGLVQLNLASNGMLHVEVGAFDGLVHLSSLILSHNHLSHLSATVFSHLHNLLHLDLSSNYLHDVEHTHLAFQPLFNLHRLDLSYNNFRSIPLGPGFERCYKLSFIDFSGNSLSMLEPGPFQVMRFWEQKERHIIFDDCHIKHIYPSTFHFIPSFSGLSLSKNPSIKHSKFKDILDKISVESLLFLDLSEINLHEINELAETFKYCMKLEKLVLANNRIKVIPKGIFFFLTKLRTLDLSQNMLRVVENLAGLVGLENLILSYNDLKSLTEDMFSELQELKHLDVSFNDLTHIESYVFNDLFNLQSIMAQGNNINNVIIEGGLEDLKTFELNYNKISDLDFLSSLPSLHRCSLSHNNLHNLSKNILFRSQNLEELDLSMNSIESLDNEYFRNVKTNKIDLSNNKLTVIKNFGWSENNGVKTLNLQSNGAVKIEDNSFVNMNELTELNLGKNRLSFLSLKVFENLVKLKVLNLNENPIGKYLQSHNSIFSSLMNLQQLFLSNVGLRVLDKKLLKNTKEMTELDISNNQITRFFFTFTETLPNLYILNASHNKLPTIPRDISMHFSTNQRLLDISGNPFRCDCKLYSACHYFKSAQNHHHDYPLNNHDHELYFVSLVSQKYFCIEPVSKRGSSVEAECEDIISNCQDNSDFVSILIISGVFGSLFILSFLLILFIVLRKKKNNIKSVKEQEKKQIEASLEDSNLLVVKIPKNDLTNERETIENVYKKYNSTEAPVNPFYAMYCGLNLQSLKKDLESRESSNSTSSNSDQSVHNPLYSRKHFI